LNYSKKILIQKVLSKLSSLKYNYFSSQHPKEYLRGKLFKFKNKENYEIELLKDRKTFNLTKKDFLNNGVKLYFPADMG